jgi:hypothetical protein
MSVGAWGLAGRLSTTASRSSLHCTHWSVLSITKADPTVEECIQFETSDVFVSVGDGKVNWYSPSGQLRNVLDTGQGGFTTGSGFDAAGDFYVTNFNAATVSRFTPDGTLAGLFGSGYTSSPESIVFDSAGNAYVGHADGTGDVHKLDSAGNLLTTFDVATEDRGSDWIVLADDDCTLYYTSEGFRVLRYDVCTGTQLSDFGSVPTRPAYALQLLSSGGVLVVTEPAIYRLDANGDVAQTYDVTGEDCWFGLFLDPDGASFWANDYCTSNVYRIALSDGAVLTSFNTGSPSGSVFGLSVYSGTP